MAFVRNVGNNTAAGSSAVASALPITVGAGGAALGDLCVLGAVNTASLNAITSVTDSKGNTWAAAKVDAGLTNVRTEVWASLLTAALVSGDTITIHTTGATDHYVATVDEFSGFTGPGFTVDVSNSAHASSTTVPAAAITSTGASEVIYVAIGVNAADTIDILATGMTAGSNYTLSSQGHFEWIIPAAGTHSPADGGPQFGNTDNASVVIVAFKLVAGSAGSSPLSLAYVWTRRRNRLRERFARAYSSPQRFAYPASASVTPIASADAAAGTDSPTNLVLTGAADPATGSDLGTNILLTGAVEAVAGGDLGTNVLLSAVSDFSGAADAPTLTTISVADAATAVDAPSPVLLSAVGDVATVADVATNVLLAGAAEGATSVAAGAGSAVGGTPIADADAAAGVDLAANVLLAGLTDDNASGADAATAPAAVAQPDAAALADTATITGSPGDSDTAAISDAGAAAILQSVADADAASATDAASVQAVVEVLAGFGGAGRVVLVHRDQTIVAADRADVTEVAWVTHEAVVASNDQAIARDAATVRISSIEIVSAADAATNGDNFWIVNRELLLAEIDEDLLVLTK